MNKQNSTTNTKHLKQQTIPKPLRLITPSLPLPHALIATLKNSPLAQIPKKTPPPLDFQSFTRIFTHKPGISIMTKVNNDKTPPSSRSTSPTREEDIKNQEEINLGNKTGIKKKKIKKESGTQFGKQKVKKESQKDKNLHTTEEFLKEKKLNSDSEDNKTEKKIISKKSSSDSSTSDELTNENNSSKTDYSTLPKKDREAKLKELKPKLQEQYTKLTNKRKQLNEDQKTLEKKIISADSKLQEFNKSEITLKDIKTTNNKDSLSTKIETHQSNIKNIEDDLTKLNQKSKEKEELEINLKKLLKEQETLTEDQKKLDDQFTQLQTEYKKAQKTFKIYEITSKELQNINDELKKDRDEMLKLDTDKKTNTKQPKPTYFQFEKLPSITEETKTPETKIGDSTDPLQTKITNLEKQLNNQNTELLQQSKLLKQEQQEKVDTFTQKLGKLFNELNDDIKKKNPQKYKLIQNIADQANSAPDADCKKLVKTKLEQVLELYLENCNETGAIQTAEAIYQLKGIELTTEIKQNIAISIALKFAESSNSKSHIPIQNILNFKILENCDLTATLETIQLKFAEQSNVDGLIMILSKIMPNVDQNAITLKAFNLLKDNNQIEAAISILKNNTDFIKYCTNQKSYNQLIETAITTIETNKLIKDEAQKKSTITSLKNLFVDGYKMNDDSLFDLVEILENLENKKHTFKETVKLIHDNKSIKIEHKKEGFTSLKTLAIQSGELDHILLCLTELKETPDYPTLAKSFIQAKQFNAAKQCIDEINKNLDKTTYDLRITKNKENDLSKEFENNSNTLQTKIEITENHIENDTKYLSKIKETDAKSENTYQEKIKANETKLKDLKLQKTTLESNYETAKNKSITLEKEFNSYKPIFFDLAEAYIDAGMAHEAEKLLNPYIKEESLLNLLDKKQVKIIGKYIILAVQTNSNLQELRKLHTNLLNLKSSIMPVNDWQSIFDQAKTTIFSSTTISIPQLEAFVTDFLQKGSYDIITETTNLYIEEKQYDLALNYLKTKLDTLPTDDKEKAQKLQQSIIQSYYNVISKQESTSNEQIKLINQLPLSDDQKDQLFLLFADIIKNQQKNHELFHDQIKNKQLLLNNLITPIIKLIDNNQITKVYSEIFSLFNANENDNAISVIKVCVVTYQAFPEDDNTLQKLATLLINNHNFDLALQFANKIQNTDLRSLTQESTASAILTHITNELNNNDKNPDFDEINILITKTTTAGLIINKELNKDLKNTITLLVDNNMLQSALKLANCCQDESIKTKLLKSIAEKISPKTEIIKKEEIKTETTKRSEKEEEEFKTLYDEAFKIAISSKSFFSLPIRDQVYNKLMGPLGLKKSPYAEEIYSRLANRILQKPNFNTIFTSTKNLNEAKTKTIERSLSFLALSGQLNNTKTTLTNTVLKGLFAEHLQLNTDNTKNLNAIIELIKNNKDLKSNNLVDKCLLRISQYLATTGNKNDVLIALKSMSTKLSDTENNASYSKYLAGIAIKLSNSLKSSVKDIITVIGIINPKATITTKENKIINIKTDVYQKVYKVLISNKNPTGAFEIYKDWHKNDKENKPTDSEIWLKVLKDIFNNEEKERIISENKITDNENDDIKIKLIGENTGIIINQNTEKTESDNEIEYEIINFDENEKEE